MTIKKIAAVLMSLVLAFSFASCAKKDSSEESRNPSSEDEPAIESVYPISIGDVEITQAPESVVSLSPATTELICDLGYFDKLAGVSDYCNYEAQDITALPTFGTVNSVEIDELLALKPSLVLSVSPIAEAARTALTEENITVLVLPRANDPAELSELYTNISTIFEGEAIGTEKGEGFFAEHYAIVEAAAQKLGEAHEKPLEAAYLRVMPLTLATGDSFEGKLLAACGFTNSAEGYTEWIYPQEKAVDLMPEVIFYDKAIGIDAIKATQIYNTTPAYKNEKCFEVDMEVFERQGARMFAMLEQMVESAG